jgi:hypothetical protein
MEYLDISANQSEISKIFVAACSMQLLFTRTVNSVEIRQYYPSLANRGYRARAYSPIFAEGFD